MVVTTVSCIMQKLSFLFQISTDSLRSDFPILYTPEFNSEVQRLLEES